MHSPDESRTSRSSALLLEERKRGKTEQSPNKQDNSITVDEDSVENTMAPRSSSLPRPLPVGSMGFNMSRETANALKALKGYVESPGILFFHQK